MSASAVSSVPRPVCWTSGWTAPRSSSWGFGAEAAIKEIDEDLPRAGLRASVEGPALGKAAARSSQQQRFANTVLAGLVPRGSDPTGPG